MIRPTPAPEEPGTEDFQRSRTGPAGSDEPRGLGAQLGALRDAAARLVHAHLDLARAELGQVLDEVKRLAALVGIAVAALLLLGLLFPIGFALFMGEWLFGSIGWGLLHGSLVLLAVALVAALAAVGAGGGDLGRGFLVAVLLGLVVGALLAFNQPNIAWARLGEALGLGVDPGSRPLVVGTMAGAVTLGVLGLVAGAVAAGGGGAIGGLLAGAVLGGALGAFSAISFGVQVGAGIGVAAALLAWPVITAAGLARRGVDGEALKAKFWPSITIETSKGTIEWLRARSPLGPKA